MPDDADRWRRVEDLFDRAADLPPADRAAFLDREARTPDGAPDPALRAEVDSLLAAHADAEGFFDRAAGALASDLAAGARIGPYRIEGVLGEGGMGTVYRAARADGQFERAVALKVFRTGDVRRFLAERRVLARLDHPGIARLYGGGVTDDGRPYFAMALVDGVPITDHAEAAGLSVEARLALVGEVCAAVQYAHARLVVHRDLKPSNVLVDREGRVRLLDFGVAKLLDEADLTVSGAAPRTPAYAAPEQVKGEPVTTATDVYALGVLLYELLTGRRPYRLRERARAAVERAIVETEPTAPSAVVTDPDPAPTAPPEPPARLARRLAGDLDQIVLKALRKTPGERYGTAEALARDVARHLDGLPVEARPPSRLYRARRFIRRHRAGVAMALVGVLVLAGWALTATLQADRIADERDRAEALNRVLVDLFEGVDPTAGGDRELTVSAFLSDAGDRVDRDLADRPDLRAELLAVLAASHLGLGDHVAADSVAARAAAIADGLPPGHPARTLARGWHAWARTYHGDYETAERVYRELLREAASADLPTVQSDFAVVLGEMGETDESRALFAEAIDAVRASGDRRALATALDGLSSSHASEWTEAGYDRAWPLQEEAVRIKAAEWGDDHPQTAEALSELAGLAASRDDLPAADSLFSRSVDVLEAAYGAAHPTVATVLNNWALARMNGGDRAGAEPLYRRALSAREAVYGLTHEATLGTVQNLAALYAQLPGREADALAAFDRAEAGYAVTMPEGHHLRAFPAAGRAALLRTMGRLDDAIRDGRRAADALTASLGPDHGATLGVRGDLGRALALAGRGAEAEPHLRAGLRGDPDAETRAALEAALAPRR